MAAILPPGKVTFYNSNNVPLVLGTVDFYEPGTTTRKTTYQDIGLTIPNANPVVLDTNGQAVLWGTGAYRQVVKDSSGNLIWDQITSALDGTGLAASGANTDITALLGLTSPILGSDAPVKSASTTSPPSTPADDDRYIVPTGASGTWSGKATTVAQWSEVKGAWYFTTPAQGTTIYVQDTNALNTFNGSAWAASNILKASWFATITAADTAAAVAGGVLAIDKDFTLAGNTILASSVVAAGGVINRGSFTLTFSNSLSAPDMVQIFNPSDTGLITVNSGTVLTPQNFGAGGNDSTDDTSAFNACFAVNCTHSVPASTYKVTGTLYNALGPIQASPGALIKQYTDGITILSVTGSEKEYNFPKLMFVNLQSSQQAIGLLTCGQGIAGKEGLYNTIADIHTSGCGIGHFNAGSISTTLSVTAAIGATSLSIANAVTGVEGNAPWCSGLFINITLDDASVFQTRTLSVTGTTINIKDPLPVQASSGNAVSVPASSYFSNTLNKEEHDAPVFYAHVDRTGGTPNTHLGFYHNVAVSNVLAPPSCTRSIYAVGREGDVYCRLNVEHAAFTQTPVFFGGGNGLRIDSLHIEGVQFGADGIGIFGGSQTNVSIGLFELVYTSTFDAQVTNRAAIFAPTAAASTTDYTQRRVWTVDEFHSRSGTYQTPSRMFWAYDVAGGRATDIVINTVRLDTDAGLRTTGQLVTGSSAGILVQLGNILPGGLVGYSLGLTAVSNSVYQPVYINCPGLYRINKISMMRPQVSLTTATGGVYADNTGSVLVTNVNNQALSTLTDTGKILDMPLAAAEATTLRDSNTVPLVFTKFAAAQAAPAAVSLGASGTRSHTAPGVQGGNLATLTFTSPHSFTIGQTVTIAGSADAAYNGTTRIVSVPSNTKIVYYSYKAVAESTTAETAATVQLLPLVDVFAFGERYSMY